MKLNNRSNRIIYPEELIAQIEGFMLKEGSLKGPLTWHQRQSVETIIDEYDIRKYRSNSSSREMTVQARLLLPFWTITKILLLTTVLPIKWLLTGHFYFDTRGKFNQFTEAIEDFFKEK